MFATIKTKRLLGSSDISKNPYGNIWKCEKFQVANLKTKYQKAISNDGARKLASFEWEKSPLPWGNWVAGSKILIEHKGKTYLRVTPFKTLKVAYFSSTLKKWIPEDNIKPFLKTKRGSLKQKKAGVSVKVRNFNLDNIISINDKPVSDFLKTFC